jgi:hypothetical protein
MANYLNYVSESKRSLEEEERKNVINKLPERLRQEFIEITSRDKFNRVPFFSLLYSSTKIRIA